MDLVKVARAYVDRMLDEVPGYKALLVDKDTVRILSTIYTQSELGTQNVFCTERIDNNDSRDHMELKVRSRRVTPSSLSRNCLYRFCLLSRVVPL